MIEVRASGKIMLAGEWSILEPGNVCIVLPVNKFVTVQIKDSKKIIFNSGEIGLQEIILKWNTDQLSVESNLTEQLNEKFRLCFYSIKNCLQFLTEQSIGIKPFELSVYSELSSIKLNDFNCVKPGLGSSAAVVVAVCKAILKFHDFDSICHTELVSGSINILDLIFKLAFLSHYFASGKLGSGFDIASATYQKPLIYKRFDQDWLNNKLDKVKRISEVALLRWPSLEIQEIELPQDMHVLIGFTGQSVSTPKMIEKIQKFKQMNLVHYQKIMNEINSVVLDLINTIKFCNQNKIINLINKNRDLLVRLSVESGINLETKELVRLIEIAQSFGSAAKITGAGGGDCGISVCFDNRIAEKIKNSWKSAGFICI